MPDDEVRVAVVAEQEDLGRLELRVDVVDEAAVPHARMLEGARDRLREAPGTVEVDLVVVAEQPVERREDLGREQPAAERVPGRVLPAEVSGDPVPRRFRRGALLGELRPHVLEIERPRVAFSRVVVGVRGRRAADPRRVEREADHDVLEAAVGAPPEHQLRAVAERLLRDREQRRVLEPGGHRVVVGVAGIGEDRRLRPRRTRRRRRSSRGGRQTSEPEASTRLAISSRRAYEG